jgi:hypothetical protein
MEWKKFHDSCNDLHGYITTLEKKIQSLEEILNGFMAEEDVMSLPSYKLLLMQYTPNNKKVKVCTTTIGSNNVFDPMYAPPNSRRNKPVVAVKQHPQSQQVQSQVHQAQPQVQQVHQVQQQEVQEIISEVLIVPDADAFIFIVELEGAKYYFHDNYIYDITTLMRAGKLSCDGFQIGNATVQIGANITVTSLEEYDGYFKDDTDKVYQKINDTIIQSVGRYVEGEIHAWA